MYENYIYETLHNKIIIMFLALIIKLNNFLFNSKYCLQIKDCVIGTICIPTYANIFMAEFEQKWFMAW